MAQLTLRKNRCALLVVDMEHDFVRGAMAVPGGEALARRLAPLTRAARAANLPVVFATQSLRSGDAGPLDRFPEIRSGAALRAGTAGVRIVAELEPSDSDLYVVKRRFSAFMGTDLDLILRSRGLEQLLVCGLSAHVCCDTTVRDAFQLGYEPVYLADGVDMGDLPDLGFGAIGAEQAKAVVATVISHRFGTVATIEDVLSAIHVAEQ